MISTWRAFPLTNRINKEKNDLSALSDIFYTAVATATGDGREGHVRTSDGLLDHDLTTPSRAVRPAATNPEQLFAAGYAACFHSAFKRAAAMRGETVTDSAVTAEVSIGQITAERFGLQVTLHIEAAGLTQWNAEVVTEVAHRSCPYSNAIRGIVEVAIEVDAHL